MITSTAIVRPGESAGGDSDIALAMDDDRSSLSVLEGAAEVVWQDRTTRVESGYMLTFDKDHAPGDPRPLPRAPRLVSPRPDARFQYRAAPPRITFEWRPQDDTESFRLVISRDPEFSDVVYEADHVGRSFVHGNLDEGRYYWQVVGIRDSIPGLSGEAASFHVGRDQSPPRLDVVFPEGMAATASIVVRGQTDPGCRVVIGDDHVPIDGDGRFEHYVRLVQGYNFLVVQSVDATGNTAFVNHTILAELEKSPREE